MNRLSRKQKKTLCRILISAGLLILAVLLHHLWLPEPARKWYFLLLLYAIPYLLIGYDVIRKAILGIVHGQLLDENFLMWIATVGAFAIGEYPEAVFVMLFYQVGELFQSIAVGRSRQSISDLMDICPERARVMRDGTEVEVDPTEVAVGELLVIRPGEKIPLDGVVEVGTSGINTKSLTGESIPREVAPGDTVISGCVNQSGVLHVRVSKPYEDSTVAKILELVERSSSVKSKTEHAITKFARIYTPCVVGAAALLALIPLFILGPTAVWQGQWLKAALIFLVVSCPCALVISVPLSYFGGIGAASKRGILMKGSEYLETLARVDTVAFDKTGTLTEGSFRVTEVTPVQGTEKELLMLAAAAEQDSNHPIAQSLRQAAGEGPLPAVADTEEIAGRGIRTVIDNKTVLVGNRSLMESVGIEPPRDARIGTVVYVAVDGIFAGSILISDAIKPDAKAAMDELKKSGVRRLVMLTGDRDEVAGAVSKELGITEYRAELLPDGKVEALESYLGDTAGALAFVGDGVNDAPVLARADVGIAMGALGSDAAVEAADVVLMKDRPADLAEAIRIARKTKRIVWQNIWFALGVKLLFLALSVFGLTNLWAATFADVGVAVIAILNAMRAGR